MMGSAVQNVVLVLLQDHDNALLLLPALVVAIKRLHARMVIAQVNKIKDYTISGTKYGGLIVCFLFYYENS